MNKPIVSIIMGSSSDLAIMNETVAILTEHGVPNEVNILSAHRTPDEVARFSKGARARGIKVIIAGAGGAAHLAGVIASHSTLPVIGVPMDTRALKGVDSLLSTVQMPAGVPVATVAIGKPGAKNAGVLALQILALNNQNLARRLANFKKSMARSVRKTNKLHHRTA